MATTTMEDCWSDVEYALEYAHLVAFDGCHKIYLAMDEIEAKWFRENYTASVCATSRNYEASPEKMLEKVREWYDESCSLRFVESVEHNELDPNAGFKKLIPQGVSDETDEDDDDEEGY
jgi:hypothetical protein